MKIMMKIKQTSPWPDRMLEAVVWCLQRAAGKRFSTCGGTVRLSSQRECRIKIFGNKQGSENCLPTHPFLGRHLKRRSSKTKV